MAKERLAISKVSAVRDEYAPDKVLVPDMDPEYLRTVTTVRPDKCPMPGRPVPIPVYKKRKAVDV